MFLKDELIHQLATPCIVVDVEKAQRNIARMQQQADELGCKLRPHIKTHKMGYFANLQLLAGASGITCAKVSEAEVMADAGIQDIFIAYPMVGEFRIRRAVALAQRIDRLILAVDSLPSAQALSAAAAQQGVELEVRLEVDTGAKRTGVPLEQAAELAKQIVQLPNLWLSGIYTFKSMLLRGEFCTDLVAAGQEEGQLMDQVAQQLRHGGIALQDISAGSTPTAITVAQTGLVNEIRPGTYVFGDYMMCQEKACEPQDVAVRMYVTVVSTPEKGYAVIDGGTKTFPMDISLDTAPYYYPGYAIVEGAPHLQLRRMNEEHGIITSISGDTGLQVGQKLCLIPIHVCTAINMQNQVYCYQGGELQLRTVDARGMLV